MKKAFIYNFGCKVNQYDGQALRERLAASGRRLCERPEDADEVFINSCTVTGEADRQCRQLARQLLKKNPGVKITITGCYAKRAPEEIRAIAPGVTVDPSTAASNATIASFDGHSRAFVKIQDGCNAFCSYCVVPLVRPVLWSKPAAEVTGEIEGLVKNGYREIVLTGVHLGKYAGGLSPLVEKLVSLPGSFRLRLSSLEIGEVDGRLIELMKAHPDRICPHLHLPLQSGSDAVLERMNRKYSAGDFARTLEGIRAQLPDAGITTDVIVGFPGETDEDFQKTADFLKRRGFSRLHVFAYSLRPGTAASAFSDPVPRETVKERSLALRGLDASLQDDFWRRFIGKTRPVVREGGKNTLLTDNYIRLSVIDDTEKHTKINDIMSATIREKGGRPWGEVVQM